jgi:putative PIN family toxin of toxin-antitoxin system
VSRLLFSRSIPAQAVELAMNTCSLLLSSATFAELTSVLQRSKFDRYVSGQTRQEFLRLVEVKARFVVVAIEVQACRDHTDDKFLSLALAGKAKYLVTGDVDLLTLDPFESCRILKPADFLNR